MNSVFSGPQFLYLIVAFVVLGFAFTGIVWIGRQIRGELGPGAEGGGDLGGLAMMETIPPAMMKEAIATGLIVPSQLAGMTPAERTFLFASVKNKLQMGQPQVPSPTVPQPAAPRPPAPPPAPAPKLTAPPADVPAGMLAILNAEKLRVWCPLCGTELQLPSFPPLVARCSNCGMKSAVRQEEGGRYVVNVSPPPKL